MGSYHDGSAGGIDATAGALVWVRRRNGSWWPGRVMGTDELPDECVVPPRSGTPIKLLGREDGSLDWYNLEKSTRVKAFRCGDYDEDIERAKASAGSNKKAQNFGKYVHREDAILHALELEKSGSCTGSEKNSSDLNDLMDEVHVNLVAEPKSTSVRGKQPCHLSRKLGIIDENSTQDLSELAMSFVEPNNPSAADMQNVLKNKRRTPYDVEDKGTEGNRRTKDLQDLGLGRIFGRKPMVVIHKKGSNSLRSISSSRSKSKSENGFSGDCSIKNIRSCYVSVNGKQSPVTQAHENSKRKSRHRPLVKVLEDTTRISVPSCHQDVLVEQTSFQGFPHKKVKVLKSSEINIADLSVDDISTVSGTSDEGPSSDSTDNICSGSLDGSGMEENELSSMPEFHESKCSGGLRNDSFAVGEREIRDISHTSDSDVPGKLHSGAARWSGHFSQAQKVAHLREGLGEIGSSGSAIQVEQVRRKMDKRHSVSNSKRKKKSKYVTLSKTAYSESFLDRADQSGTYLMERAGDSKANKKSLNEIISKGNCGQVTKYGPLLEDGSDVPQPQTSKTTDMCGGLNTLEQGFASEVHVQSAEDVMNLTYTLPFTRHCETSFTGDVAVSTMSPGKSPTSSHDLSVQVLEPGNSVPLVTQLYDVKLNVQRSYHGPRVPLVSLRSKLDDISIVGHPVGVQAMQNGFSDDLLKSIDCHPLAAGTVHSAKTRADVNSKPRPKCQFPMQSRAKKLKGKSSLRSKSSNSKKLGYSPRKIRRLSSITVDRRYNEDDKKPVMEKIKGPVIACVPLRLVFSRINEALTNSARPASCI